MRFPLLALHGGIRPIAQQELHHLVTPQCGGVHQRGPALVVQLVHGHLANLHQKAHHAHMAQPGGNHQGRALVLVKMGKLGSLLHQHVQGCHRPGGSGAEHGGPAIGILPFQISPALEKKPNTVDLP